MKKIIEIKKLTNEKFLNLYNAVYQMNGQNINWQFASRRSEKNLEINNHSNYIDAVIMLPYIKKDDGIYIVFTKEFRSPLNKYVFGFPAGCKECDEDCFEAASRELYEEIGATVVEFSKDISTGYSSAGLTDEKLECITCEVKLTSSQHLEPDEDINLEIVKLGDCLKFLDEHDCILQAPLMAKEFYYKNILNNGIK